jgi:hypothetical protein
MKLKYKIIFLALWPLSVSAIELDREPYLQSLDSDSVTVVWRGTTAHSGAVFYGTDPASLGTEVQSSSSLQHEVQLTGLEPDTSYTYRIESDSVLLSLEESYSFRTAPKPGTRSPFRFWVVGDSGTGGGAQYNVKEAMKFVAGADLPEIYLHVGDMAYSDGTDAEFTARFFLPYRELLSSIPVWPAIGNHEGRSSFSDSQTGPYFEGYVLPTQGEAGGLASGTEAYYSFDYANAHFISLDSHQSSREPGDAMLSWLEADLAATEQEWVIAFWHHPPYTKGSHDSDTEYRHVEMRENALPILEAAGVDLVFGGHSHIYERSYLLDGAYETPSTASGILNNGSGNPASDGAYEKAPGGQANDGAIYVVAGHGGTSVGGAGNHPLMAFSEVENGSVLVDVHENRLSLRNVRKDGIVTDRATLIKGDGIHVIWPNGGERIEPGDAQEIRWASVGEIGSVSADYSCDNGQSWFEIESGVENDGDLTWTAPNMVGPDFRVRVRSVEDPSIGDFSDGRFELGSIVDQEVFPFGSLWRYHDAGEDLGAAWLSLDYDDSQWQEGPGQLGYGDGDESTVLYDADPVNIPSVYFRKVVAFTDLPDSSTIGLLYDDAAAIWINESLVYYVNFGNGSHYSAWSSASSDDNALATVSFDDIPWVQGENIIAVMVKQRSEDSSDLSFDMSLLTSTRVTAGFEICPVQGTGGSGDSGEPGGDASDPDCGCSSQRRPVVWLGLLAFAAIIMGRRRRRS